MAVGINIEYRLQTDTNDTDGYLLEDGSGVLVMEVVDLAFNNYHGVKAADGISVGERIR